MLEYGINGRCYNSVEEENSNVMKEEVNKIGKKFIFFIIHILLYPVTSLSYMHQYGGS